MYENGCFKFELKDEMREMLAKNTSAKNEADKNFVSKLFEEQVSKLVIDEIVKAFPEAIKLIKSEYNKFLKDLNNYS